MFPSILLSIDNNYIHLTMQYSFFSSMMTIGGVIGGLVNGLIVDYIGRKNVSLSLLFTTKSHNIFKMILF